MADNNYTLKFNVDIKDFSKALNEVKSKISQVNSQFSQQTAGMGKWSKSTEGLKAKLDQLNKTLDLEKRALDIYQAELKELESAGKGGTKEAEKLRTEIEKQKSSIANTESSLKHYNSSLAALEKEQKEAASPVGKLTSEISKQEDELKDLKRAYANSIVGNNPEEAARLAKEIDKLSGELADNKKKLSDAEKAADELDKTLEETGESAQDAGGGFTVFKGAVAGFIANAATKAVDALKEIVTQTIEVGKTFDKSMSNVAALSGASAKDMEMLRNTAKEFGSTTQFSASQAADALGYMALAGWDAKTSASALGGVLDLAAASNMDLAKASDMVTDYMSAFNMEAKDSAYFADVLAYAQANANTNVEQLGEAFKNSAANMNAAGQDVETTTSLLAMMANQGLKGSEAGTALTAVMRDMTAKMKDGAIQIGDTAVSVMDANGNYRDMTDILKDVENATDGLGDAEKAAALSSTFTSDSIKGLNLILNAGVDNAAEFEEELRKSGGTAKETAKVMNDNLGGDLTALGSQIEGLQISLYEKFEPALRKGVSALSALGSAVGWVIDHSAELSAVLAAIGAALLVYNARTIAAKVATVASTTATKAAAAAQWLFNAAMSANPIGIVIAAIAGLVAAFVVLWNKSEGFRNFWIGLWDAVKRIASSAWTAITGFFSSAWEKIKAVWSVVSQFFANIWAAIKQIFAPVIQFYATIFGNAWTMVKNVWQLAKAFFLAIWNSIKAVFSPVISFFKEKFDSAWTAIKNIWNQVKSFFSNIWTGITSIFSNVTGWFKDKFSSAWTAIKNVFSPVGSFFGGIWDTIKSKFTNIGQKVGDAIKGTFKSAINGLLSTAERVLNFPINAVNSLISKINAVPGINLSRLNTFSLPRMAVGGVLDKGARAVIAGEAGAEAIVPLERNKQWISKVAQDMLDALKRDGIRNGLTSSLNGLNSGLGSTVTNNTRTQNVVFNQYNTSPKALDRLTVYRQTNSLLFSAKVGLAHV